MIHQLSEIKTMSTNAVGRWKQAGLVKVGFKARYFVGLFVLLSILNMLPLRTLGIVPLPTMVRSTLRCASHLLA